jgi:voltage-gated potassium channel
MKDHIVILNCPIENGLLYFEKALEELRKSALDTAQKPVIVVSDKLENGLSHDLRNMNVAHVSRPVAAPGALEDASVDTASSIVILSQNMYDPISDSLNFDLIHKIRERGVKSTLIVEMLNNENKERALAAGADHVIRPIRSYPELLVRTILAPGTEQFVEDLFDVEGEECIRYEAEVSGRWGSIACKMIEEDIGTPLAFLGTDNKVVCNIHPDEKIQARALFVLVREGNIKESKDVQACLQTAKG